MYGSPVHVACIMDGNGRWAKQRGLPRTAGHTAGEENLAAVVRSAVRLGIDHLTVFGFSTENWVRPRQEVRHILGLHKKLFGRVAELNELNVRVRWIGRPFDDPAARTPRYVQRAIAKAIRDTEANTGMTLTVAFDYGSRTEIAHAAETLRRAGRDITVESIDSALYEPDLPSVDVLVRTSGETRVSNFLLWQAHGAAISFASAAWPDYSADDLRAAVDLALTSRDQHR
jgi:undecaprenyl diphosphate synthase